jgi:hypothetical protein
MLQSAIARNWTLPLPTSSVVVFLSIIFGYRGLQCHCSRSPWALTFGQGPVIASHACFCKWGNFGEDAALLWQHHSLTFTEREGVLWLQ